MGSNDCHLIAHQLWILGLPRTELQCQHWVTQLLFTHQGKPKTLLNVDLKMVEEESLVSRAVWSMSQAALKGNVCVVF